MKEIIHWLRRVEQLASETYRLAARAYRKDSQLSTFLEHSAEDEAWHYHVMGSAASFLAGAPDFTPAISIDPKTNDKILGYLSEIKNGVKNNTLLREELIEKIVRLELSEWNDIFLYVVNVLKEKSSEFIYPVVKIQSHLKYIENFIEKTEKNWQLLQRIKDIPPIWIENILIVDDEDLIAQLIKSLLHRWGNIDIAYNGSEALRLIEKKFYKLIISDVDMPTMNGITLYKEAIRKFPTTKHRFLFITGGLSMQKQSFFKDEQIKHLEKPVDIALLRDECRKIIITE